MLVRPGKFMAAANAFSRSSVQLQGGIAHGDLYSYPFGAYD